MKNHPFWFPKGVPLFTFPGIRVGTPGCHESLTVFPLFAEPNGQVEYLLSDRRWLGIPGQIEEQEPGCSMALGDSLVHGSLLTGA